MNYTEHNSIDERYEWLTYNGDDLLPADAPRGRHNVREKAGTEKRIGAVAGVATVEVEAKRLRRAWI